MTPKDTSQCRGSKSHELKQQIMARHDQHEQNKTRHKVDRNVRERGI